MSMPYRRSNGTQIRIAYAGGGHRHRFYDICLEDSAYIKKCYKNLIADLNNELLIIDEFAYATEEIEAFLYGNTVKKISTPLNSGTSRYHEYIDVKKWNEEMVDDIDWQKFMASFYAFAFSETSFAGGMWQNIKKILLILGSNKDILFKNIRCTTSDEKKKVIADFWNVICCLLKSKVEKWLSEETCWLAFVGVREVKSIFAFSVDVNYDELEDKFCSIADKIAVERLINDKLEEHNDYDVNWLFFYDDYLELESIDKNTRKTINFHICERYKRIGDYQGIEHYHAAARWYEMANKYANDYQKEEIRLKMKPIEKKFSIEKVFEIVGLILAILTLLSIVAVVVFIVLFIIALIGSFKTLNSVSIIGGVSSAIILIVSYISYVILGKMGKIS